MSAAVVPIVRQRFASLLLKYKYVQFFVYARRHVLP